MAEAPRHFGLTRPAKLVAVAVAAGVAWWVVGSLPWIITGLNGSINLYYLEADYHTAVPLHGYGAALLFQFGLIGGVSAGLVGVLAGDRRPASMLATFAGTAGAMILTHLQSYVTAQTADNPLMGTDGRTMTVLFIASVTATVAGWALGTLARTGRVRIGLMLSVLAGTASGWLWQLVDQSVHAVAQVTGGVIELSSLAETMGSWIWPPLLVAALVVIGIRPPRRLVIWPVAVLTSWFIGVPSSVLIAASISLRMGDGAAETMERLRNTLEAAVVPDWQVAIRYLVAIVVAVSVTFALEYWHGRRSRTTETVPMWA